MLKRSLFRKPKNTLEYAAVTGGSAAPSIPDEMWLACPGCKKTLLTGDIADFHVCPTCGHHFRINARQRIDLIVDEGSFSETDATLVAGNPINFPNYEKKLKSAALQSAENEAVICGTAVIGRVPCALFIMEPFFMMGSMGSAVGEKLTRLFELAKEKRLPVIGFTVSGGARMQEGILSLMQMAKVSGAVKRHSDAGLLYLCVLTDPTTGGVTASFAMEGDIILAEPGALVCFTGPRVIEQTIRQKLPEGFQKAEFLLEKGFIDAVVPRSEQKKTISALLALHTEERR